MFGCAHVFTLHANSDVPVTAQTSCCCCWRSSHTFFSMFYCVTECVLPPVQCLLVQASQSESRAANRLGICGRFYGEGASLGPSIPPLSPLLSLGNAPSLQTEILSLHLSLSLKAHMVKFFKKTCDIQPKGLANQQDRVGRRLEGLVPALAPAHGHSREMNPGGSSHCGEALFNAPISPCLAEMDSHKVIQGNLGVLRALQSRGGPL